MYSEMSVLPRSVFTHPVRIQRAVISLKIAGTGSYVCWPCSMASDRSNKGGVEVMGKRFCHTVAA